MMRDFPLLSSTKMAGRGEQDTGWQRIKSLFTARYTGDRQPEQVQEWIYATSIATFVGFVAGGFYGTRITADRFISSNQFGKFPSKMHAQRELQANAMLGFVRYGCRWGWKVGAFASLFTAARVLFSVYRGRDGVLNYTAAGGLTGAVFKLKYGLKPIVGGAFLGCLVSLPVGMFIRGLDLVLVGSEARQKMTTEHDTHKREIWQGKLSATEAVIDDLEHELSSSQCTEGADPEQKKEAGLEKYYTVQSNSDKAQDSTKKT